MPTAGTTGTNLGRGRPRKADSAKRAPLPGWLPKGSKGARGRAAAPPAHLRVFGVELDPDDRAYIQRKLGMKLGKFASSIDRVSVRVEDVNGPRGGIDHECRIKVVLSGLPSVVLIERDASLAAAIDRALAGSERAVRRAVRRKRMKGLKRARRTGSQRRRVGRTLH
jgi:ribosome-associated translation inhibitor RaiA